MPVVDAVSRTTESPPTGLIVIIIRTHLVELISPLSDTIYHSNNGNGNGNWLGVHKYIAPLFGVGIRVMAAVVYDTSV